MNLHNSIGVSAMKYMLEHACLQLVLLLVATGTVGAQGHRLRADRVEVQSSSHWRAWQFPADMVEISSAGTVKSRFIQAPHNAVLDAADFTYGINATHKDQYDNYFDAEGTAMARGGIKKALSNAALASRVLDGDAGSFWEPDPADPLADWVLEIDLGRLVSATRLVLRFAEAGDPFLQFRVHSAGGQNPFGTADRSGALDYVLVGGTTQPNRDQRLFEFDLQPVGEHSEDWTGRMVQYLRIAVTAANGDRAELLAETDYQALATADRGAVEYVWKIAGEERLVSETRYRELPIAQQGGVRYYRRERPRLADVEVWTVGQNIALGLIERGGSAQDVNPNASPELAFDGNMRTEWAGLVYDITGETAEWGLLNIDLGAHFRVEAVRFVTRVLRNDGRVLYGYLLRGSDGSRAPDGSFIWDQLSGDDRQINQSTRLFEDRFTPSDMRFLEFRNLDVARRTKAYLGHRVPSVVTEIQVYATGYLPILEMSSDLIDLGSAKNLTTIDWQADTPVGTAVEVRTRTGNDLREVNRYFKQDGTEVATEEEYNELPSFFKGEILVEVLPGNGWSNWSQAYIAPGEAIRSPSPRRYMMIQTRLLTDDIQVAPSIDGIQVNFTAPFAQSIIGEIAPNRQVPVGESVDFDLFVRPTFAAQDPGFDRLRLVAPSRAALTLRQVRLGTEAELLAGGGEEFLRQVDGRFANVAGLELTIAGEDTDSLSIGLPSVLRRGGVDLVEVAFTSRVFQSGSTFQVEVGNSGQQGNWQEVDPGQGVGDALGAGEGLTVLTPLAGHTVKIISQPGVFTPNGDGINDRVAFEFAVLKINTERLVVVELFDLGGRRVRRLQEQRNQANGLYSIVWDGRNQTGDLVPPGLYLARIAVASDKGVDDAIQQIVGVVY